MVSEEQPENASSPTDVRFGGSLSPRDPGEFLSDLQFWKSAVPMDSSFEGRVTVVSAAQPENAESPMEVMDSGRTREVELMEDLSWEQFLKADAPMERMVSGISTDVRLIQFSK